MKNKLGLFEQTQIENFRTEFELSDKISYSYMVGISKKRKAATPVKISTNVRYLTGLIAFRNPKEKINGFDLNINILFPLYYCGEVEEASKYLQKELNYLEKELTVNKFLNYLNKNIETLSNEFTEKLKNNDHTLLNKLKNQKIQKYLRLKSYIEGFKKITPKFKQTLFSGTEKQENILKKYNMQNADYNEKIKILEKEGMLTDQEYIYGKGWAHNPYTLEEIIDIYKTIEKYFVEIPLKLINPIKPNEIRKLIELDKEDKKYNKIIEELKINNKTMNIIDNLRTIKTKIDFLIKTLENFGNQIKAIQNLMKELNKQKEKIKEYHELSNRKYIIISDKNKKFLIDKHGEVKKIKNLQQTGYNNNRYIYELENGKKEGLEVTNTVDRKLETIEYIL